MTNSYAIENEHRNKHNIFTFNFNSNLGQFTLIMLT